MHARLIDQYRERKTTYSRLEVQSLCTPKAFSAQSDPKINLIFENKAIERLVENTEEPNKNKGLKSWLKKIGLAGFLFFLIKGLVWLAIFFGLGKYLFGE